MVWKVFGVMVFLVCSGALGQVDPPTAEEIAAAMATALESGDTAGPFERPSIPGESVGSSTFPTDDTAPQDVYEFGTPESKRTADFEGAKAFTGRWNQLKGKLALSPGSGGSNFSVTMPLSFGGASANMAFDLGSLSAKVGDGVVMNSLGGSSGFNYQWWCANACIALVSLWCVTSFLGYVGKG